MRIPLKLTPALVPKPGVIKSRAARAPRGSLPASGTRRWRGRWLELIVALAAIAVLATCLDHLWAAPLLLAPLLAVPPALAGIGASGPARPLAFGVAAEVAAAIVLVMAKGDTHEVPVASLTATAVVTAISAISATASHKTLTRRLTKTIRASLDSSTQQQLANAVSVAEVAQRAVLRPLPRALGPLELGVVYLAAAADAKVGGDLYDVALTPFGIRLIIGDVRGKGLGAVEVAADVLGRYRQIAYEVHTLPELARRLDAGLSRRWGEHEEFVTALLAEFDPQTGKGQIFSCGHPPAMLIRQDGTVQALEVHAPAPPLGLMTLGDPSGAGRKVDLKPNDQLLLYTDGVTEARDKARDFYPLQQRLASLAASQKGAGRGRARADLLGLLRADLLKYVGEPLDDDAALLLVRAPGTWPVPVRGGVRAITA
ncbi:MAG TPA: PP2C family protein-serine/threonine phosphatase [Trebonia sp.]|nr:PP2C family protein-serine/threonine phosphatase [Trebonia sp.]